MTFSLSWLPKVLRDAGLKVIEVDGWQTRGHGDAGKTQFVICHHIGDNKKSSIANDNKILVNGRPDLTGPLCNLSLARDGTFYVIAAGKAFHAGKGLWHGVSEGNSHAIGIEAANDGRGEKWPATQMQAYAKGCAAIAKHCGFSSEMVCGHKEYALPKGRKSDPSFDMETFRTKVTSYMK